MKKAKTYISITESENAYKRGDKVLYNSAFRRPVKLTMLERIFNRLNSPWLALILLAGFIALCWYCYPRPIQIVVPHALQQGYDHKQAKVLAKFIKTQLAEYKDHQDKLTVISIFDSEEK